MTFYCHYAEKSWRLHKFAEHRAANDLSTYFYRHQRCHRLKTQQAFVLLGNHPGFDAAFIGDLLLQYGVHGGSLEIP